MHLTVTADWVGNTHHRSLTIGRYRATVIAAGEFHTADVGDRHGLAAPLHSRHRDEGDALDWAENTIRELHDRATTTTAGAPLAYTPPRVGIDTHTYALRFRDAFTADPVVRLGIDDLPSLATSPHWPDRVRAELLREQLSVTLPDQFPCLYETPDSPSQSRRKYPAPNPWVVSPDIDMLHLLLADYQQMWDAYTDQWGPASRRIFTVGRLDGLSPGQVYRPGATPADVIGHTMTVQGHDLYHRQDDRIRAMHPQHHQWTSTTQAHH